MASARIVKLTAFTVEIPLRRPIRHASHSRHSTENVVVRCQVSDGTVGWGEGVPRDYVTGESADSALDYLRSADLAALPATCASFAEAVALAERISLPVIPGDDRNCQGNAARCALELAILDAFGRCFGESLTGVTELIAPDLFRVSPRVQYSSVITSARGPKFIAAALGYRFTGFRQLKIKVGIDGYDDAARLRRLRRLVGGKVRLRADANEAWPADEALQRISDLEPARLEWIEQPIRHEDATRLADIRANSPMPIMLDESLCSAIDAERAIAGKWCDLFNLRLSKCGGYIPTLRLAQLAEASGIRCQLGCQVGESAILTCAGRHFAASVDGLTALEGSFDRHLVAESLAYYDHTFGRGGWAPALDGSGHGAMVDESAIARCKRREEVLRA